MWRQNHSDGAADAAPAHAPSAPDAAEQKEDDQAEQKEDDQADDRGTSDTALPEQVARLLQDLDVSRVATERRACVCYA